MLRRSHAAEPSTSATASAAPAPDTPSRRVHRQPGVGHIQRQPGVGY